MTILPNGEISMSDKDYYQITTNTFQRYADNNLREQTLLQIYQNGF